MNRHSRTHIYIEAIRHKGDDRTRAAAEGHLPVDNDDYIIRNRAVNRFRNDVRANRILRNV